MIFSFALLSVTETDNGFANCSKGFARTLEIRKEIPQVGLANALSDDPAGLYILDILIKERIFFDPFLVKAGEKIAIDNDYSSSAAATEEEELNSLRENSDVDVLYLPYEILKEKRYLDAAGYCIEHYRDAFVLVETDEAVPDWLSERMDLLITTNGSLISPKKNTILDTGTEYTYFKEGDKVSKKDKEGFFSTVFRRGRYQDIKEFFSC